MRRHELMKTEIYEAVKIQEDLAVHHDVDDKNRVSVASFVTKVNLDPDLVLWYINIQKPQNLPNR